jgi:hypothetical protein
MSDISLSTLGHRAADGRRGVRRRIGFASSLAVWLLAGCVDLVSPQAIAGSLVCKPVLIVKSARLSPMRPPTLERVWSAVVSVDASNCASTAGYFELGISRMKENSPDLKFREQFIWSTPSVTISVDFAPDEAVGAYWIDSVQLCTCAKRK